MSGKDDNKGTAGTAGAGEGKQDINIVLDRTQIEKDLQAQLEAEKTAKTALNTKITEQEKALEDLKKANQDKTTQYTELETEAKKSKDKLAEIAMKEFNRRKDAYVETMKKAGLPDEKITSVSEKVKTPKDLDDAEVYLTMIPDLIKKAEEDRVKAAADAEAAKKKADEDAAAAKNKGGAGADAKKGGGVTKLEGDKSKEGVYQSYREGVDDLYQRRAKGDKDADRQIKGLWELGIKKLKEMRVDFGIQECPRCGGGIKEGEVCPYCGFDPATYIRPKKEN